ncbi:OTU domain-containing protein 5 [Eurytemora carolleeae]|uniref:OTU domain-containing protein 5 n=1 Tax=Eurytemora carolleeae TaxID=1294199 RepID=UPI000C7824E5|nr:OTU domain-containing protein 5 [Eurytemora carolleeae]|eukprot:XP_023336969.1 OTU domain-containing protein 5-like [Eurytemora affinis]
MTILPKKKTVGGKNEGENETHLGGGGYLASNQGSEELLFVAANVPSDTRWGSRQETRPPSTSSPSHWSSASGSREEKRHSSPVHPADFEDSLDGVPAKRARQAHPRHARSRSSTYVSSPSSSRVETPLQEEQDGEYRDEAGYGAEGRYGAESGYREEEELAGYNSEDEYSHVGVTLTEAEWVEKDLRFERVMRRKGYTIKLMGEDGACLFRAVADQLYGDQDMHRRVRSQCMNYIESNNDYYAQYVTEDFKEYVRRKRLTQVHGNHLEIQALSELYNRPIHIYCYSSEPINIFQNVNRSSSELSIPIRLSYHRGVHYNSVVDPNNSAIGVGLGLPGVKPGCNTSDLSAVLAQNDNNLTETQMLEDKIRFTDWEATNEAIEEQVARESYLLWVQEQEKARNKANRNPPAATVTSGQMSPRGSGGASPRPPSVSSPRPLPSSSTRPRPGAGTSPRPPSGHNSPQAGCSSQPDAGSPEPGSSRSGCSGSSFSGSSGVGLSGGASIDHGLGPGFRLRETATFLNNFPSDIFGLDEDEGILSQVLAESQQEYLESLKRKAEEEKE